MTNPSTNPSTNPATNPDGSPATGAKPFTLPAFCTWASTVCDWQKWTKDKYKETTDSVKETYKEVKQWFTTDPDKPEPEQPEFTDIPHADSVNVSFGAGCPAPVRVPFRLMNSDLSFDVSYQPICDLATMINPIIRVVSTLGAIYILAGIRQQNG